MYVEIVEELSVADLKRQFFNRRLPQSENWRNYYGKISSMDVIENAIRAAADFGVMAPLCDLESESVMIDPHLSGVLAKRCGAIKTLEWDVVPPDRPDDERTSKEVAVECKRMLAAIPDFQERLYDLEWAVFDGRALLENHWHHDAASRGAPWRVREMCWVHPRRLSYGPERELRVVDTWRTYGNFAAQGFDLRDVSPGKFVWWTPRTWREYPEREGLGPRTLYWTYFKRFSWRMRMALTEVFGVPWRIVKSASKDPNVTAQSEDLENARDAAEKLGSMTTVALARGVDLDIEWPGENSGQLFKMTNEDVDLQMSKLVLGQTGTTDPTANRAESVVGKGEQDIFKHGDAQGIEGRIQQQVVAVWCRLNYGRDAVTSVCPQFRLRGKAERDRTRDLERAERLVQVGVPVAVAEMRDIAGFRPPAEDEQYVVAERDTVGNVTTRVVDPVEERRQVSAVVNISGVPGADTPPPLALGVDAMSAIVKVNEARASSGLSPLQLPGGAPDPDGELTIEEYRAKLQARVEAAKSPAPPPSIQPPAPPGPPEAGSDQQGLPTDQLDDEEAAAEDELDRVAASVLYPATSRYDGDPEAPEYPSEDELVAAVLGFDPERDNSGEEGVGNPDIFPYGKDEEEDDEGDAPVQFARRPVVEDAFTKASRDGARVFSALVERLVSSVPENADGGRAHRALSRAAMRLPLERLQRVVERHTIRAAMVGAAEALWESENDAAVPPAKFASWWGAGEEELPSTVVLPSGEHAHALPSTLWPEVVVTLPVGRWETFDACVAHMQTEEGGGHGEESARKICGAVEQQTKATRVASADRVLCAYVGVGREFVRKPFEAAVRAFAQRRVLTRQAFYRLSTAAKKRAFTISGIARRDMLETAHDEVTRAIREGVGGKELRARLAERFTASGWTPLKPSRVDLVFRNATMGAYASGRHAQMTQPHVLAARPYWQVLGANDDATRPAHRRIHGKVFAHDDDVWKRTHGGPPLGHNCRCRKVSRSEADLERLGLKVSVGGDHRDVPDEGWR